MFLNSGSISLYFCGMLDIHAVCSHIYICILYLDLLEKMYLRTSDTFIDIILFPLVFLCRNLMLINKQMIIIVVNISKVSEICNIKS
jgi:hypothetical protein